MNSSNPIHPDTDPENIEFTKPSPKEGSYRYTPETTYGSAAAAPKKKGLTTGIGILLIVLLVALLIFGALAAGLMSGSSSSGVFSSSYPYIGILYIEGTIGSDDGEYNHSWTLHQIKEMREDPDNMGILLYVNSPGGSVYQTDEVYRAILKYQEDTGCPVYAYFAEYAASGGYYLAAGSDHITANRFTTTGSIGVYYGPMIDVSELIEKAGISVEYIKSGANKAMGNYFTPLTEEQRAIYQAEVDEIYDIFVDIVAEGRDLPRDTVLKIADGRSYTASQALENGLIDEIGTLSDVKSLMKKETGVEDFETFRYEPETTLISYLFGLTESFGEYAESIGKSETEKTMDYVQELSQTRCGYMALLQQ